MDMAQLTEFFGFMAAFHFVALVLVFFFLTVLEDLVFGMHEKITGLDKAVLKPMYIKIMGQYKLLWIVFAMVPYLALKYMGH